MSGAEGIDLRDLALPPDTPADSVHSEKFRLGPAQRQMRRFAVYAGDADAQMPTTFDEFAERFIANEECAAVVYDIVSASGRRQLMPRIIIPERYAHDIEADDVKVFVRLQPADLPPLLAELPDPSLIGEIVLRADCNPQDHWHRHTRDNHFISAAAATPQVNSLFMWGVVRTKHALS